MKQIDFPFHIDSRGQTALADQDHHIRDMIEQFLFTSPGERVNRPDFGSGLLQMIFAPTGPEIATALQHTIQAGLQRWLGDLIEVRQLTVTGEDSKVQVKIAYLVRQTGEVVTEQFERSNI